MQGLGLNAKYAPRHLIAFRSLQQDMTKLSLQILSRGRALRYAAHMTAQDQSQARVLRTFTSDWGEALEEVTCPLCGANESQPVLTSSDLLYAKPGVYHLVRCRRCQLSYVNPRPTFEALGAHYPDDYIS